MTRILLVEDNRADARLLAEHLRDAADLRFELTSVETLQGAIAAAAQHDVVLLDLSLPDASGLETVTRMIAAARSLPIIVLTGRRDDRTAIDAVAAGAQDYLQKDEVTAPLLVKTIRYAIERKKAEEHAQRLANTHEALQRARFVADVMAAASSSLDVDESMRAVSRLLVPTLADFCAIDVFRPTGMIERVAHAAADPAHDELLHELSSNYLPGPRHPRSTALAAVEARNTVVVPVIDLDSFAPDARFREIATALRLRAQMATPLIVRDRIVAVITYAIGPSDRSFGPDQQLLAEEIASRLALAIENARLFSDAQRALRGRDELIAIVSHDLRNPLGVVDLALDLLARDPARSDHALPRAQRAVVRMKRLIEDLLEVSRIDAGTLQIDPQPTELGPLLEDIAEQHRALCAQKGIRFSRDVTADIGAIDCDKHRLAQVLGNLLGNAIKFTPRDGQIALVAHGDRDRVTIAVADTGAGISREHLAHIFDRFWQAPDRKRDGVGLGLAIVKGIVDAHRGTIAVDSELGRGTTFRLTLPRKR